MFFISHYVFVFAFPVTDFFSLPDVGWFHLAVSVDLTSPLAPEVPKVALNPELLHGFVLS